MFSPFKGCFVGRVKGHFRCQIKTTTTVPGRLVVDRPGMGRLMPDHRIQDHLIPGSPVVGRQMVCRRAAT